MVLGGIRHGDPGAVDDLDAPLAFVGGVPMNVEQRVVGKPGTGAAIAGGAGTGTGLASSGIPGLDLSETSKKGLK